MESMRWRWRWLGILSVFCGCGPAVDGGETTGAASGSGTTAGSTSSVGETSSSDEGQTVGSTDGSTGSSTGALCQSICFVDFTCTGFDEVCLDAHTIQRVVDITCTEAILNGDVPSDNCDPNCCEGSGCAFGPPEACAAETSCVMMQTGPECRPNAEVCDGRALTCGDMQVCELAAGLCPEEPGPLGLCVDLPSEPCPEGKDDTLECGCDGVTYPNTCARLHAGVGLAHLSACEG